MPMTRMFDTRCVWGLRVVAGVVGLLSLALAAQAELPPREYRRMQREAPEELRIHVLRVGEAPVPERPREREIIVEAKVVRIGRSAARIHEGEVIKIVYRHYRGEREVAGPGEPPLVERGRDYPAFLAKVEGERHVFSPAAGRFSFERLEERRP
jgi:hypothetical protein